MDSPVTPNPQQVQGGVAFTLVKDQSSGKYGVAVTHIVGLTEYRYVVPLERAEEFADGYAQSIKNAAAEGRRIESGLVIPADVHPNGNRQQRRAR